MGKKIKVTIAVCVSVLMMLYMAIPAFAGVSDIQGHWAEATIERWVQNGFILGYPDGTFRPENLVTRAEFAALANRSLGFQETVEVNASDVNPGDWFYGDIAKALARGYMSVFEDGTVKPGNNVTREEAAVMLARMLQLDLTGADPAANSFTDTQELPDLSKAAISAVASRGYMIGLPDNTFLPAKFLTRAEIVTILDRLLTAIQNGTLLINGTGAVISGGGGDGGSGGKGGGGGGGGGGSSSGGSETSSNTIRRINLTNGYISVTFRGEVPVLSQDDFVVTAELDGSPYTLEGLAFDPSNNSFSFNPVAHTGRDMVLKATVAAASGGKIKGQASDSIVIEKCSTFIELDSLTINEGEGGMQGCDVGFTLMRQIGTVAGIRVGLYTEESQLAENNATQALLDSLQPGDKELVSPFMASGENPEGAEDGEYWSGFWDGEAAEPTRIVIEVAGSNGEVYILDSQEVVWVDQAWRQKVPYENVGPSKLFGLNSFDEIQPGVDAVNPYGTVIVADGVYPVVPNDYNLYYGIVIWKPMTLLGAQAGVQPEENRERGDETDIVGSVSDQDESGGGAFTICRKAGAVTIDGFTFKYNEIGIDLTLDWNEEEWYGRDEGVCVINNRFIDNFIDVLIDNNDSGSGGGIRNYMLCNNVFGTYEYNHLAFDVPDEVRAVVNSMHNRLENALSEDPDGEYDEGDADEGGIVITLELSLGLLALNPDGLVFENNTVYGKLIGVGILGSTNSGNSIYGNNIYGNRFGIGLLSCGQHTVDINRNILEHNTLGLTSVLSGGRIDATENWWGAVDWLRVRSAILGEAAAYNINKIEYFPWALNSECSKIANGDLTQLVVNPAWKGKTIGLQVSYGSPSKDYYIGINAFPDIRGAVKTAASDYYFYYTDFATVNIVPGTYKENLTGYTAIESPVTLRKMPGSPKNSVANIQGDVEIYSGGVQLNSLAIDGSITAHVGSNAAYTAWAYPVEIMNTYIHNPGGQGILFIVDDASGESAVTAYNNHIVSGWPNLAFLLNVPAFINGEPTADGEGWVDYVGLADAISEVNNDATVLLPDKEIYGFAVEGQLGYSVIDPAERKITFRVPNGTDVTALEPDILVSPGAAVSPASGTAQDFTAPVIYTVTAVDGTAQEWEVSCIVDRGFDIISFAVDAQAGESEIDPRNCTVTFHMPYGADVSGLAPIIEVSPGAAVSPASGVAQDFTGDPVVVYTVTAAGGAVQEWNVECVIDWNTEADIISFSVPEQEGDAVIDPTTCIVIFYVPYGTDVTALVPDIEVSDLATIEPESGEEQDFTDSVYYVVTAENVIIQQLWEVVCVVNPNTETDILEFEVEGQTEDAEIDKVNHKVKFYMAYNDKSELDGLAPVIVVSDQATIDPPSGSTRDLSKAVVYKVTAGDAVTYQHWVVTCVNTAADILSFSVTGMVYGSDDGSSTVTEEVYGTETRIDGIIDDSSSTVTFYVPAGMDLTDLETDIEVSPNAVISPYSGETQDFSDPVQYTVTPEDGAERTWTVICEPAEDEHPQ